MYLGASLALLSDVTPPNLIVPSVALFMFIVTLIGGNAPLLVPLILSLRPTTHHNFHFTAAAPAPPTLLSSSSSSSSSPWLESAELINYSITRRSGTDLQITLVILFTILYLLSTLVYYICAYVLWKTPNYETLEQFEENQEKDIYNRVSDSDK